MLVHLQLDCISAKPLEVTMRFGPFLLIALALLICWVLAFVAFHVASGLIHLLLLFAVISFLAHFLTGGRRTA